MSPLDKLIEDLELEARKHRYAADILDARIQGLREARQYIPGNGAEPPPHKRRRNIRQMVREQVTADPAMTSEEIAKAIGCRLSRVQHVRAGNPEFLGPP